MDLHINTFHAIESNIEFSQPKLHITTGFCDSGFWDSYFTFFTTITLSLPWFLGQRQNHRFGPFLWYLSSAEAFHRYCNSCRATERLSLISPYVFPILHKEEKEIEGRVLVKRAGIISQNEMYWLVLSLHAWKFIATRIGIFASNNLRPLRPHLFYLNELEWSTEAWAHKNAP